MPDGDSLVPEVPDGYRQVPGVPELAPDRDRLVSGVPELAPDRDRLVSGAPVGAVICAYRENGAPDGPAVPLTGGLGALVEDLNALPPTLYAPKSCTMIGTRITRYLIRFRQPDRATSWVATASDPSNECTATTNGAAATWSYVGDLVDIAHTTGRWPGLKVEGACDHGPGRRGQEAVIVPADPVSVTICMAGWGDTRQRTHGGEVAKAIAYELNALPAGQGAPGPCGEPNGKPFNLVFQYATGPPAAVMVWNRCVVTNLFRWADPPEPLRHRLLDLAERK